MNNERTITETILDEEENTRLMDEAIIRILKNGHLNKEEKNNKPYYDAAYKNMATINQILSHLRIRILEGQNSNNMYLVPTTESEQETSLIRRESYSRETSIFMVLLANHIWNDKSLQTECFIEKDDLFEEFQQLIKIDGDKSKPYDKFKTALERSKKDGFIKCVSDDDETYIIQPYIKCKISREALAEYMNKLAETCNKKSRKEEGEKYDDK